MSKWKKVATWILIALWIAATIFFFAAPGRAAIAFVFFYIAFMAFAALALGYLHK